MRKQLGVAPSATTDATTKTYVDTELAGKQPLDSDLTTIAGLTATTDNFLQAKSSAWASRTVAQVKTDLGLTNLPAAIYRHLAPYMVAPVPDWFPPAAVNSVGTANNFVGNVCRVPVTGTLHDLMFWVNVSSGNVGAAVYDVATGTSNRTRLWASGSVACAAQGWQVIGDPNLSVTEGQLLTLGISCDNTTAQFGRATSHTAATMAILPSGFIPEGSTIATAVEPSSFPDPGSTWTGPASTTLILIVVARVTPS